MSNLGLNRRRFLAATGLGAAGLAGFARPSWTADAPETPPGKFFTVLSCGRIGVKASFREAVDLAAKFGFEGVDPDAGYFAGLSDDELKRLLEELKKKNLKLGAAGLPVDFRKDEATFSDGLKKLAAVAAVLERAGVTRVSTWIMPCSDTLTYLQNFRSHAARLRECAAILKDHGQRLGLEYVSPRTLWRSQRHPFVHTLSEVKELIVAIGTGNVGVQLDSWHWFNAEETGDDLLTLRNEDIVTVDLNDAPAGVPLDKQADSSRELPAATGVIPVKVFLDSLRRIGYDGPIHAEPFNAVLRAMPREEACAATAAAMKKALAL
ncbi:MAG: sugar phosphate isomerase/epimerase family protein [Terriglobia bacterium]